MPEDEVFLKKLHEFLKSISDEDHRGMATYMVFYLLGGQILRFSGEKFFDESIAEIKLTVKAFKESQYASANSH